MRLGATTLEKSWPLLRDILSFGLGAWGIINEMQHTTRDPVALAFFAGIMGVPAMLGVKRSNGK